jgi:plasmid stabilization system protein ParE
MTTRRSIDVIAISFPSDEPPVSVLESIAGLTSRPDTGILDVLLIDRREDGSFQATSVSEFPDDHPLAALKGTTLGLAAETDLEVIADAVPPGAQAFVVAITVDRERSAASAADARADNLMTKIAQLADMHDAGALSDDEFGQAKAQILGA